MDVQIGVAEFDTPEGSVQVPVIELILSERNLKTLLLSLDDPDNGVTRLTESGLMLTIRGESNEVHYQDRTAGLMGEEIEEKLLQDELTEGETLYLPDGFGKMND